MYRVLTKSIFLKKIEYSYKMLDVMYYISSHKCYLVYVTQTLQIRNFSRFSLRL